MTEAGPVNPLSASNAARRPDCAAAPACKRLVQLPSARYSMMPEDRLPDMPSALTIRSAGNPRAAATAAAAAGAPMTAVG